MLCYNVMDGLIFLFFSGPPFQLETVQNSSEIENGGIFRFDVQIKDKAGNVTSQPRLNVICKVWTFPIYCYNWRDLFQLSWKSSMRVVPITLSLIKIYAVFSILEACSRPH